jgi:hypothetical protein
MWFKKRGLAFLQLNGASQGTIHQGTKAGNKKTLSLFASPVLASAKALYRLFCVYSKTTPAYIYIIII